MMVTGIAGKAVAVPYGFPVLDADVPDRTKAGTEAAASALFTYAERLVCHQECMKNGLTR